MGDRPLTILIGGIPGVGKTSISGYLAKELGIDIVLSGDYLREFLRPFSSHEEFKPLGVSVYEAWKEFGDKNDENILNGFLKQGELLNRGVKAIIKRSVDNGEPLIIESLYFIPEQLGREILDRIISIYVYISDKELHIKRLNERQEYTHRNSPGKRLSDQLDTYRVMMNYSLSESNKFGLESFDNINYLKTREDILEYIKRVTGGV